MLHECGRLLPINLMCTTHNGGDLCWLHCRSLDRVGTIRSIFEVLGREYKVKLNRAATRVDNAVTAIVTVGKKRAIHVSEARFAKVPVLAAHPRENLIKLVCTRAIVLMSDEQHADVG